MLWQVDYQHEKTYFADGEHEVMKKVRRKKTWIWIMLLIALAVGIILAVTQGYPYYKRHFKAVMVDEAAAISGNKVPMDNRKVLSVYFTRVGNSDFDKDINAVSGASLMLDGETLIGNSQLLAEMIRDAVGGDIVAIQTKKKYPSSYDDTVSEARTELNKEELPELAGDKIPDWESYDVIFLTYPVWWGTIPMAVRSFLSEYDFSGKKVIPVAAHGGSKFGNSLQDLSRYCNGEVLADSGLEVYCDDVPFMREKITEWLKRVPV